ncbi:JAB domain-containing protein [Porphyrobacter sp. GA68]|uniref:JAB domain-containing protein n=1 Tax=Porphyrobacter sp. GA68 TaxID=2883480 RepID=UPI001D185B22|nr:JAB domain-containing protein [Porphyrobacter sp. GA68]
MTVFAGSQRQFFAAEVLGQGNCKAIRCSWRHLFARALAHDSRAVLLAHNHPSGNPQPSAADLTATRQIGRMANLLGIHLIDHLIIAGDNAYSMRGGGQL